MEQKRERKTMETEEINKFVGKMYRDKARFAQNLSDLLLKIGICILHDTNADTYLHECSGGKNLRRVKAKFNIKLVPDRKEKKNDRN